MASKNTKVSSAKNIKEKNPVVGSGVCDKCLTPCEAFIKYQTKLKNGSVGKGIVCKLIIKKNKGIN